MDYYIDIVLKPNAEMRENVLLNKIYMRLHKALCDLKARDIGISFPDYKVKLGKTMRIHGVESKLIALQNLNWLGELSVCCLVSEVKPVPQAAKYRVVYRQQANMTAAKLRRLIKREGLSEQEAKKYKAKMFTQGFTLPYLEVESSSTGHKYRHFINFGEIHESPLEGEFNQFGLSKTATIPWF